MTLDLTHAHDAPVFMGQTVCYFERQDRSINDPLVVLVTWTYPPSAADPAWRIDGYAFPRRGFPYAVTKAPLSEIKEPGCATLWQNTLTEIPIEAERMPATVPAQPVLLPAKEPAIPPAAPTELEELGEEFGKETTAA